MSDRGKVPWVTFLLTQKIIYMNKNYFGLIIRGTDYNIGFNVHALLMYEKLTNANQSFSLKNLKDYCTPKSLDELCKLYYCCVVTGTSDLDITYQEFIDELGKSQSPYVVLLEFRDFLNDMKMECLSGEEEDNEE